MKKSSFKRSFAAFLAILMIVTSFPIMAFATNEAGIKPNPGTTQGQPFRTNQPSEIYRIPSMVVLDSGTIVTAADARWNGGYDGGGNDTIVARSTDGGTTWSNQFVNYYPDNGNEFNTASTSVCDTELVTDGKNVYMLTVFFPAGYALNASSANNQLSSNNGTAFVTVGNTQRVKLSNDGGSSYNYYLGDFDKAGSEGRAKIYSMSGTDTGYSADHDYYLYKNGVKQNGQNLFYSDSDFQTAKVNFLLFRKSSDEGETWSDFIPVPVKNASEAFFGVGPGSGVYDAAHGRIIFSTYTWNGSTNSQRTSFIYTDDEGKTWTRSGDFPNIAGAFNGNWSSESTLVQLDDNRLRCFVRNGWKRMIYADAVWDGSKYNWTSYTDAYLHINGTPATLDTGSQSGCQISAIKYSKKLQYNGNYYNAILISCPQGERSNGVIYTLLYDDEYNFVNINSNKKANDKNIQYSINSGYFGYSCLKELSDGTLVDLYETNAAKSIQFSKLPDITTITGLRVPKTAQTYDYILATGTTQSYITDGRSDVEMNAYAHISYKQRKSVNAQLGDDENYTGAVVPLSDSLFDFTKNLDGTWNIGSMGVYMTVVEPQLPSSVKKEPVTIQFDSGYFRFIDGDGEALAYWRSGDKKLQYDQTTAYGGEGANPDKNVAWDRDRDMCLFEVYRPATDLEDAENNTIPGFVRINSMEELESGGQYIIGCQVDGSYYFLYPSTSTNNTYSHSAKMIPGLVDAGYLTTVQADNPGSFSIQFGQDTYNFSIIDYSNEILGVIDYDPVIYTHGSTTDADMEFTYIGDTIADGTYDGEKSTFFRFREADCDGDGIADDLSKRFKILSVSASNVESKGGTAFTKALTYTYDQSTGEYQLHGNVPLANTSTYTDFTKGDYVDIKTTLEEISTGEVYTQTDRLYVTSNPVPGHVLSSIPYKWTSWGTDYYRAYALYIIAPGSMGNTRNKKNSDTYSYSLTNAKHIFNPSSYSDMTVYNNSESLIHSNQNSDNVKYAGYVGQNTLTKSGVTSNTASREIPILDYSFNPANTDGYIMGTYYLDVSSPYAEDMGISDFTKLSDNSYSFKIDFERKTLNYDFSNHSNDVPVTISDPYSGNRPNFDNVYGGDRSLITKIGGDGNITTKTYADVFGAAGDTYYIRKNGQAVNTDASTTADCTVNNIVPNKAYTLKGALRYHETCVVEKGNAWNDVLFPFEIKYCDKSDVRTVYENSIKNVLKSTEYTTTTWDAYMDKALTSQEYLNNYIIQTKDEYTTATGKTLDNTTENFPLKDGETIDIPESYSTIQKSAQFGELKQQLDEKQEILDNGLEIGNGVNYTPSSFIALEELRQENQAFYDEKGIDPKGQVDDPDKVRANLPGWEIGPYSEEKLQLQIDIDDRVETLKKNSVKIAADDSAYLAVKDLYNRIDLTAYEDGGKSISDIFTDYDVPEGYANNKIYLEYNNKLYVDVPADATTEESPIDRAVAAALTEMNVGIVKDNVKNYNVTINLNGTEVENSNHPYGEMIYFPFGQYFTAANLDVANLNVECSATSYREDENGTKIPTATTVNLSYYANSDYNVPILIQNDIVINVTTTEKTVKQATIVDYYGTVIGTLTGDTVTVNTAEQTVTDGIQTIKAKNSPKYSFTKWSLEDGTYPITEGMVISQVGTLIPGACIITANGGTVNTRDVFNSNQLNLKLTFAANNPNAIWTKTINGKTVIASYEPNFVQFSSGVDVDYQAYDSVDALPDSVKSLAQSKTPSVTGIGYTANNKFTLSVDYTAPTDKLTDENGNVVKDENGNDVFAVNVLDAGIVFTNTNPENLYKGGEGTVTYAAPRIGYWSDNKQSGTFTMSKSKGIEVAYMRAYVSYTSKYSGADVPFVVYSDTIYKCELVDGSYVVTPIN